MAALLEGLRALGSGRVLDEVLALVLDLAIEVTGAERGFIMLANRERALEFRLARGRGRVTLSGRTFETSRKIPEAAIAIENARLYREALDKAKFEQELKVAAAIQQSLLPTPVRQGPFFATAAASIACRAVGGDFFDYVDLPSGGFGFIVGDVAGKGSPAALLAAAVLG